jgi:hypothetical protein
MPPGHAQPVKLTVPKYYAFSENGVKLVSVS